MRLSGDRLAISEKSMKRIPLNDLKMGEHVRDCPGRKVYPYAAPHKLDQGQTFEQCYSAHPRLIGPVAKSPSDAVSLHYLSFAHK